jgi:GTP 3',8-cyclase
MNQNQLIDKFQRVHNYLRVSLTDACNFRCQYCVASFGESHHPSPHLMSAEEIEGIVGIFAEMGIDRVRFTGGEPLVRRDSLDIFRRVGRLPLKLSLTTNGFNLEKFLSCFKEIGLRSINVSLDTLHPEKFLEITRVDGFTRVKNNIDLLLQMNFHVKLNVVVMNGFNNSELCDFVAWTKDVPIQIRFIEFMPFKGNAWEKGKVFSLKQMLEEIGTKFEFEKLHDNLNDTDKKYQVKGFKGSFGVISSVTEPFCSGCNRLRITADGKMKNCLFSQSETDLITAYRKGEDIRPMIKQTVEAKFARFGGQELSSQMNNRAMISIGG